MSEPRTCLTICAGNPETNTTEPEPDMSSFELHPRHIKTLVATWYSAHCARIQNSRPSYYIKGLGNIRVDDDKSAGKLANLLAKANRHGVWWRYDRAAGKPAETPEETEALRFPFTWDDLMPELVPGHEIAPVSIVEALKLADCIEYQSCDADDWYESDACAALDCIRRELIRYLPGYDAARWCIE